MCEFCAPYCPEDDLPTPAEWAEDACDWEKQQARVGPTAELPVNAGDFMPDGVTRITADDLPF